MAIKRNTGGIDKIPEIQRQSSHTKTLANSAPEQRPMVKNMPTVPLTAGVATSPVPIQLLYSHISISEGISLTYVSGDSCRADSSTDSASNPTNIQHTLRHLNRLINGNTNAMVQSVNLKTY